MEIGYAIFDITLKFDQLALDYLRTNTRCQYLFLSSGAVYGTQFDAPATRESAALVSINSLSSQEWYGAAKLHAECRHRAHAELNIFDIRVFNYFSRTQDISARFLITDILRAIRDKKVLKISPNNVTRDFLHPSDFYKLVLTLLATPAINTSVDCYSRAPIDKDTLLKAMRVKFDLDYEITDVSGLNATGSKAYYYSLNTRAADYGYQPGLTSLAGILIEAEAILSQGSLRAGGG